MNDILRITVYLLSFIVSAYALSGVDFARIMRGQKQQEMQILYLLLSLALAYAVAQFVLGLSLNFIN